MSTEMCQVLVGSKLRLKTFSTESWFPESQLHAGPLRDLLTSPVLAEVRDLQYDYRGPGFWLGPESRPIFEHFIQLISTLVTLEKLVLGYPLNENWFAKLRTCTSLRHIVWDYSHFPTDEVPYHFKFEDTRLTKLLRETLSHVDPAPYVEVHSRYRPEQRGIARDKEKKGRELRAARGLAADSSSSEVDESS
jgi:hypothetical protein